MPLSFDGFCDPVMGDFSFSLPKTPCGKLFSQTWIRKDVGASTVRLSRRRALALPQPRISNSSSPRREIWRPISPWQSPWWKGYHTPNVDAPLRIFLALNLRDSTAEDNVRKRPFTSKIDPHALTDYSSQFAKTGSAYLLTAKINKKNKKAIK